MPRKKTTWVEVKVFKRGRYPYTCTRIRFEMWDNGGAYDAVKTLMADMGIGPHQYNFIDNKDLDLTAQPMTRVIACRCGVVEEMPATEAKDKAAAFAYSPAKDDFRCLTCGVKGVKTWLREGKPSVRRPR